MKLLKEIQLQFVGRHDKKATFMRHFPGDLQEQDGAIRAVEAPYGVDDSLPYKQNFLWPQKPNIALHNVLYSTCDCSALYFASQRSARRRKSFIRSCHEEGCPSSYYRDLV